MLDTIKRVAEIKNSLVKAQEMLQRITATAEVGGGMVKVTANGNHQIIKIEMDPEIVDKSDMTMLQDLIVAGVNKALQEAAEAGEKELRNHTRSFLPKDIDLSEIGL